MSDILTAEQVREAIFNGSSYASYDGAKYYADGISMQAIADELNATLGGGECARIAQGVVSYPAVELSQDQVEMMKDAIAEAARKVDGWRRGE